MGSIARSFTSTKAHIVLFPLMAKGHIIPLMDLAHLLFCRHRVSITIFTTPKNSPFIRSSLVDTVATIIELPFNYTVPEIPAGVESTDKLPSISLMITFIKATKNIQPHFEKALQTLPTVSFIVSDAFLHWTLESASKFNIPRLAFYGMSNFPLTIFRCVLRYGLHLVDGLDDCDSFSLPFFPSSVFTWHELGPAFRRTEGGDRKLDFMIETDECTSGSQGVIVNGFYEIESAYADYWNREIGPRSWYVGPLCVVHQRAQPLNKAKAAWVQWLDEKLAMERPVLYVAFGTHAELSMDQLQEIRVGLEDSGVDFLLVLRWKEAELGHGFEERVAERGLVVRDWVDQVEILEHEGVKGFMSHCGWNSVLESISAKVPILAWPMAAEQHLNAKMVEEEMGIGLRIPVPMDGSSSIVGSEIIEKMVRELMVGEKGKVVREKAKEVGEAARKAMAEGGSSYNTLDLLLEEFCGRK